MEWIGGRVTDVFMTVSDEEAGDARRLGIHRNAVAHRNGRDPGAVPPRSRGAGAVCARDLGVPDDRVVVVAVSRLVRHKGYPELPPAMRDVPDAELWVVGERLDSDRGDDM